MRKPIIAIKLSPVSYAGLINLGNRVFTSMTGNISFTTPSPTLLALQTAVTDVENAYAVWSPLGSRGSHASLVTLRSKSLTLYNLLKAEAQYVQNTAILAAGNDYADMADIIASSGFQLAGVPTPQGVLQAVVGFRTVKSPVLNSNQVKLRWKRPLDVPHGDVSLYRVLRAAAPTFSAAVQIGTTTTLSFIDTNTTPSVQTYTYWVIAVNNAGDGAVSDAVTVKVLDA